MSGHGRATASSESVRITVEVRSVNHRFQRVSLRLPGEIGFLEDEVRRMVQASVRRGKVDLTATVEGVGVADGRLDMERATGWATQLRDLAREIDLAAEPTIADLLALPGVVLDGGRVPDADEAGALAREAVGGALAALDAMRQREGRDLADDLSSRVAALGEGLDRIVESARDLPARTRDALRERIAELLADSSVAVEPDRLAQEAAYYSERADITEEVVRLGSHLEKIGRLLESSEPAGRTLEFVVQEVYRELNTVGSKTKDLGVIDEILELKAELERIREQVQNIE